MRRRPYLVQAERDPLLSRIAGSEAGTVTFDRGFLRQFGTYGLLPLATVLATQFPEAGRAFDMLFRLLK